MRIARGAYHVVVSLLAVGVIGSAGGQSKVGTTAVPFLGISVGPRATSLGGAFAAVANDATCLYYNPGALSQMPSSQLVVAHTRWLLGTDLNWVGLGLKLDADNAVGLSLTHLDYGEEEVTTVYLPEGTGERWGASDIAASLSYCRNLTDRFSIGGSVKYIQQKLWNETASALALDVGLLFVTHFNDLRLGMSISNFGTDMRHDGRDLWQRVDLDPEHIGHNETIVGKLKTETWPLPLFFRVGLAMDALRRPNYRLTVAADAFRPSDNTETVNVGAELELFRLLELRCGYKSLFRSTSEEGLTAGVGVHLALDPRLAWRFEYAFADFGLFEAVHMVGASVSF
ncbi:MAG: PorV/PorQ family protein [candidate division KSB1 bacterium]|nr:PorV/PorQ family protein [candidate division KSB1 bacterium]MDZ7386591.1 PorV/PorQ family protein [candidate division KSB1 bacterium]MDZ7394121.1 PorV/PorQ family protein [candidate division KSB1 bacterium]